MRFLVDENLPISLADWLVEHGFDAAHTSRLGFNATADIEIARYAVSAGAVAVTKDADYVTLARQMKGLRVVHMQVGNLSSRALIVLCEQAWARATEALNNGDVAVRLTPEIGSTR